MDKLVKKNREKQKIPHYFKQLYLIKKLPFDYFFKKQKTLKSTDCNIYSYEAYQAT